MQWNEQELLGIINQGPKAIIKNIIPYRQRGKAPKPQKGKDRLRNGVGLLFNLMKEKIICNRQCPYRRPEQCRNMASLKYPSG